MTNCAQDGKAQGQYATAMLQAFAPSPVAVLSVVDRWWNTRRAIKCLIGHLGIDLLEASDDFLWARMPVDNRTRTPAGVVYGDSSVALAQCVGVADVTAVNFARQNDLRVAIRGGGHDEPAPGGPRHA